MCDVLILSAFHVCEEGGKKQRYMYVQYTLMEAIALGRTSSAKFGSPQQAREACVCQAKGSLQAVVKC